MKDLTIQEWGACIGVPVTWFSAGRGCYIKGTLTGVRLHPKGIIELELGRDHWVSGASGMAPIYPPETKQE